jgi:hypothetical protein
MNRAVEKLLLYQTLSLHQPGGFMPDETGSIGGEIVGVHPNFVKKILVGDRQASDFQQW